MWDVTYAAGESNVYSYVYKYKCLNWKCISFSSSAFLGHDLLDQRLSLSPKEASEDNRKRCFPETPTLSEPLKGNDWAGGKVNGN